MLWLYNTYLTLIAISAGAAGIVSILLFRKRDSTTNLLGFVFLVMAIEATRAAVMQGMFGFSSRVPIGFIWFALAVRTLQTVVMACFALQLQGILVISPRRYLYRDRTDRSADNYDSGRSDHRRPTAD